MGAEMTFVFDLDGTLCHTDGQDYGGAVPVASRIARVNALYLGGHTIVIDTARGSGSGVDWSARTRVQLARWGVAYHQLRCGVKFPADVYIDDKAQSVLDWDVN